MQGERETAAAPERSRETTPDVTADHPVSPATAGRLAATDPVVRAALVRRLQRAAGNAQTTRLLARDEAVLVPPRSASFAELWRRFDDARVFEPDVARELAPQLVDRMAGDVAETIGHGIDLVNWLLDHGLDDLARRALDEVESAWRLRDATIGGSLEPIRSFIGHPNPSDLIGRAERAARAGNHTLAFEIWGRAYLFLQMQLERMGPRREAERRRIEERVGDAQAAEPVVTFTRIFAYHDVGQVYAHMRRIFGFYYQLEREHRAAGNDHLAASMSGLALLLRNDLRERFLLSGAQAMVAEVTSVDTPRGPGLRIHGANMQELDVTQLPGLPSPREVGSTYQWFTMDRIHESLSRQAEFTAGLLARPEIVREFRGAEIDMNNLEHRIRVWRVMYSVFLREDQLGFGVLGRLLSLMRDYLQAFTVHTSYNVRDWGVSYLDTEMPIDLAGRAERDCGVYALMAAYEVYRTAREARPRLPVDFELWAMLDHVTLVIYDRSRSPAVFYVLNNDHISEAQTGDVEEIVARAYGGGVLHARNIVTPAVRVPLGSTSMGDAAFRRQAWERYLDSASWGLAPLPSTGPGDTRSEGERRDEAYRQYYSSMTEFDRAMGPLETALDGLADADRERLERELARLSPTYMQLARIFHTFGPHSQLIADASRRGIERRLQHRYLYVTATAGRDHPLVRVAMALQRLQHLGTTLAQGDLDFLRWANSIEDFGPKLLRYQQAGFPARF